MTLRGSLYKIACFAALVLAASSCKVSAPFQDPVGAPMPSTFTGSTDTASIGDMSRKEFFEDQYLRALIDTALNNNLDMLQAVQRVEQVKAGIMRTQGALLPTVNVIGSAGVEKYGKYTQNGVGNYDTNFSENIDEDQKIPNPTPDFFLGLRSSWEVDLWGKLRNHKRAAYIRFLSSEKGKHLVQTALVSQVAELYYNLIALDRELEIIQRNISFQEVALEMIKIQKLGGRATELAVQQFHAQLLSTRRLAVIKQQQIVEVENQMNLLLGQFSQPIVRDSVLRIQDLPEEVKAGIPSDMLCRRPDVQQAELGLAAVKADMDAARAAFLPSLTITPYLGFNAFEAPLLFKTPESLAMGIFGGLAAPVFNRKAIQANYNRIEAERMEAVYAYQKAILQGFQEVQTNLKRLDNARAAHEFSEQEVEVLTNAVTTSNDLFMTGYATYLEVITAQKSVLEAELGLIDIRKEMFLSVVDLYRSLGGGWQ